MSQQQQQNKSNFDLEVKVPSSSSMPIQNEQSDPRRQTANATNAGRKKDVELERLDLKRKLVLMRSRWQGKVEELNAEVSHVLDQAKEFTECADLSCILRLRLERMYAMLPGGSDDAMFPDDTVVGQFSKGEALNKLSPTSALKLKSLEDERNLTKAGLSEFDKGMASIDASVNKALALLNKTCTELQVQKEKDQAKEERLRQIRGKRAAENLKVLEAARKQGQQEAEHEEGLRGSSDSDNDAEDGEEEEQPPHEQDGVISDLDADSGEDSGGKVEDDDGAGAKKEGKPKPKQPKPKPNPKKQNLQPEPKEEKWIKKPAGALVPRDIPPCSTAAHVECPSCDCDSGGANKPEPRREFHTKGVFNLVSDVHSIMLMSAAGVTACLDDDLSCDGKLKIQDRGGRGRDGVDFSKPLWFFFRQDKLSEPVIQGMERAAKAAVADGSDKASQVNLHIPATPELFDRSVGPIMEELCGGVRRAVELLLGAFRTATA